MDETLKPLRVPPQMFVYADQHNVSRLVQSMVCSLVIDQPDDPISYLIKLLQRSSDNIPRVMVLGPPAVGKHTVAKKLSDELRAVHVTKDSLLQDQPDLSVQAKRELSEELLGSLVQQRLKEIDCFHKGWVLEGIPQTRLQALSLQQAGVIPEHVVMLEASDDVLMERNRGRLVDPITGDVYHQTFILPNDGIITQRLEKGRSLSEKQRLAKQHHYCCEVTGLRSAYQHVLKVFNSDQPHADVYQQGRFTDFLLASDKVTNNRADSSNIVPSVLAFVQTHQCSRTPRILLLGPPGSGKSHQARLLSEKYQMVDVSCGQLLRSVAAGGSSQGEEIKVYLNDGHPVPDSLVLQVLEERLSQVDCTCRGWILHDFPCDLQQARSLQELHHEPNRVFFLEVMDDICLERLTLRATDPVSGQSFHTVTRPPPNSEIQNRLKTRPEDSVSSVTQRLREYRTNSAALQSVYPDAVHVDADQDPHTVCEAMVSRLTLD